MGRNKHVKNTEHQKVSSESFSVIGGHLNIGPRPPGQLFSWCLNVLIATYSPFPRVYDILARVLQGKMQLLRNVNTRMNMSI